MQKGQSSSSKGFPEETRLGQWFCTPICSDHPWPTSLSSHWWISAYFDIGKGCQSYQVSTRFVNINGKSQDRTALQAEVHLWPFERKPLAGQVASIYLQAPTCTFPFGPREGRWGGAGNIGRSWKVTNKGWKYESWINCMEERGKGRSGRWY